MLKTLPLSPESKDPDRFLGLPLSQLRARLSCTIKDNEVVYAILADHKIFSPMKTSFTFSVAINLSRVLFSILLSVTLHCHA